ncbi:hypothetical protein QYR01_06730 [Brucella anthropi]|uniref:hypothetical protein n=1 Tax=Brucella anthropi TaxID=529 RepID=UPI0026732A0A|nr:hypothetical protein [Brucella anthropi]WKT91468.1 hypothetical protein QYR01_06730 [Brucella anthropi]
MRDIAHNIGVVQAVAPAVLAATTNSAALDLIGFESAAFVINTGEIAGDGVFSAKVQESDQTTAGSFTDVDPDHLHGAFPATLPANGTAKIGYRGFKRYVRLVLTKASGTSIAAGAVLIKGNAAEKPVA